MVFGGDLKINWKIVFQRSVSQVLTSDSVQINDCSCNPAKDQVLIFVPPCGTPDLYLWCATNGRYLCVDCLSQEGVGGTEERQLLFPLRCPSTRRQLCDLFSSYLIPAVFMVPHSPKKKTETSPSTALIFATDVEETSAQDIWDLRNYRNTCFSQ